MVKYVMNDGLSLFEEVVANETITTDPPSIAAGATATVDFAVPGAALGDYVLIAPPYDFGGLEPGTPYVSAADTVSLTLRNNTGGAIDLASGGWKVKVLR